MFATLGAVYLEVRCIDMSESRPKNCTHCKLPTTLHLTKVIDGEAHKLGLCSGCPNAKQLKGGVGWNLFESPEPAGKAALSSDGGARCPNCGLTPADFKEHGRLGCPQCYEVFEAKLTPLIASLHRGSCHVGKAPRGKRRSVSPEQIEALKKRLDEHVSREEYEMAAVVRDQLRSLES